MLSFRMIVIVFGVSGAGKTTIGQHLARNLGWNFYEADDFHSPANIEKMHAGYPLTDQDRQPWIQSLRQLIERSLETKQNAILACSALRKLYRQQLRLNDEVLFVYLHGSSELIAKQIQQRPGHFMNPKLLESQFATLEEPGLEDGTIVIELGRPPQELVKEIKTKLSAPIQKTRGNTP